MNINQAIQLAYQHYQAMNLTPAIEICLEILAIQPNQIDAMNLLGRLSYDLGNYDEAIEISINLLEINPNVAETLILLGSSLYQKGYFDDAIAYHQKALQLNPSLVEAYTFLAMAFQEKGNLDEALRCFQKVNQLAPIHTKKVVLIYINKKRDALLFANLKCGYSSLEFYREQGKIDLWEKGNVDIYYKVAIVRNPYKRIESFYKDKLIMSMSPDFRQFSQMRLNCFFPKARLINREVSFKEFVDVLNNGYTDQHLIPQHTTIPEDIDKIVHLENHNEHEIIRKRFNIEFIKLHSTDDITVEMQWTDDMKKTIQKCYYEDFQLFGYEF